jgi:hypothetical protein
MPNVFPIYDSYVEKILKYFKQKDKFYDFKNEDLKTYHKFREILVAFQTFYELKDYNIKDIDRYLWQLGKRNFPNKY